MRYGKVVFLKPLIVGVDPGTTVGLAFLDARGKVVDVESGKSLSFQDIVWEVRQKGTPLIVACDRLAPPRVVKKLVSVFKCRLFAQSLTKAEKQKLVRGMRVSNSHEADALATALKAYNLLSPKLRQIARQEGARFEERLKPRLFARRKK